MCKCDKIKEKDATYLAKILFRQIEKESPGCAFWVISALTKMAHDKLTLPCVINIVRQEMRQAAAEYDEYVRTT